MGDYDYYKTINTETKEIKLSNSAKALWAKKAKNGNMSWLPLMVHLADTAEIADLIWNNWLSDGVRKVIGDGIGVNNEKAKQLFVFLSAVHDIGKATPVFQAKPAAFPKNDLDEQIEEKLLAMRIPIWAHCKFYSSSKTPHALATMVILKEFGCSKEIVGILGGHHGKPPDNWEASSGQYPENFYLCTEGKEVWSAIQDEYINYAMRIAGYLSIDEIPRPELKAQVLLCGLVIMADWIASNESLFPYLEINDNRYPDSGIRAEEAWNDLQLPRQWNVGEEFKKLELYKERFGFKAPNAMQSGVLEVARSIQVPGILVIEAPMGSGKTEAALVAAEALAYKTGRSGIYFALPTQATSDGIFPRIINWMSSVGRDEGDSHALTLAHGKAQFNKDYRALKYFDGSTNVGLDENDNKVDKSFDGNESIIVHEWFEGRKKSMLSDFVVGTIDQLLLAALKQKHLMLRHLGLANKVVIIDECHAYDAYMSQYLEMALRWLGAYGVPVVVLSATLTVEKRRSVIESYLRQSAVPEGCDDPLLDNIAVQKETPEWVLCRDYPRLTWSEGEQIVNVQGKSVVFEGADKNVRIDYLANDEEIAGKLKELLSEGGCAGVIVNTVKRAQNLSVFLRCQLGQDDKGDEVVEVYHSRFLAPDRIDKEDHLRKELGKRGESRPPIRIVVGTQVLEQSLDIDFDVLITDLCPMDLLLQRIGRLHRHERVRPPKLSEPTCFIACALSDEFEQGAKRIYGDYLLMRTKALVPEIIRIPQYVSALVQDTYGEESVSVSDNEAYKKAKSVWELRIAKKKERAEKFRIVPPWAGSGYYLVGWLNTPMSEKAGEASVRDTDETIEVLVVREQNGGLSLLNGRDIPRNETPDEESAIEIARQSITLPQILCSPWKIDSTIRELEELCIQKVPLWQESFWLKGELFLILNENNEASLNGYKLVYNKDTGLICEKEDALDV